MKKTLHKLVVGTALLTLASIVFAQAEPRVPEDFEPAITIIDRGEGKIEEYRANGKLYMIKVTPKKGRPYYLVDADGDGMLESHRNEMTPNLLIPSWVLFSW